MMTTKNVLLAFAVVGVVYGVAFLLIPGTVAGIYDLPDADLQANLVGRYFGAALIGWAVLNFLSSSLGSGEKEGLKAVLYANLVACITGVIATIIWLASDLKTNLIWLNIVIYGAFGLAFAYLLFVKKPETSAG